MPFLYGVLTPSMVKIMRPIVAIVGRPNVGKSSLLNAIAGERVSIVAPVAGVTRDRVSVVVERQRRSFEVVDTGGIGIVDSDRLEASIEEQIAFGIESADVIVFLVDTREGRTPSDEEIARHLRRQGKPVVLAANKAESPKHQMAAVDFAKLGLDDALAISAQEGMHVEDLLDLVVERLPDTDESDDDDDLMRIAIVGKRNSGKSTLINTLAGAPRVIVSEVAGTTRDSVDVRFELDGEAFIAIDTAGMRRKERVKDPVEFYSQRRTVRAIQRAHVVLFLMDATTDVSQVDKKIASLLDEHCKPCVLVFNKWDLVEGAGVREFEAYIRTKLPLLSFAPISMISAKESMNLAETIRLARELFGQAGAKVSTWEVNKALADAYERRRPEYKGRRAPKIYYATQTGTHPPTMVIFANDPKAFDMEYRRYLKNHLRKVFPFNEIPIRLRFRKRERIDMGFEERGAER